MGNGFKKMLGALDLPSKNELIDYGTTALGVAGMVIGGDAVLNKIVPQEYREKINGTWWEPVAHGVIAIAGSVAAKKLISGKRGDQIATGLAAGGIGLGLLAAYRIGTGQPEAVAGLGIFADVNPRDLLMGSAPTTIEQMNGVTIEDRPMLNGVNGASFTVEDRMAGFAGQNPAAFFGG
jgi:hypothetical protein